MKGRQDSSNKFFGLTGGIGTGKSVVAAFFRELGAHIIDTDRIAREVVEPGRPVLSEIAEYFGREMLNADGSLNRALLRDRIIRDKNMRDKLNSIIHPSVNSIMMERMRACEGLADGMPVIVDVPLLYEVGWDCLFTEVILAYAPVAIQIRRLIERDGLDRKTAELAVRAQMDIDEKRGRAMHVIDNSGSLEHTREQVERLFELIRKKISTRDTPGGIVSSKVHHNRRRVP